jgi:hypothetical protein
MLLVMAILIKTSGKTIEVFPQNGHHFQFEEFYHHLNCTTVEFIELSDGRTMICNANAKLSEEWEINLDATELFRKGRMSHSDYRDKHKSEADKDGFAFVDATGDTLDVIAGNVLVGSKTEII